MANQNFDPLKNLNSVAETIRTSVNKALEDVFSAIPSNGSQALPVDVFETNTAVVVKAGPLYGVDPEKIDVSLSGDSLTIKGEIKPDTELNDANYLRRERKVGSFTRTVTIPRAVKADEASASYKDGILTITLPKEEEAQPKIINVKTVNQG